MLTHSQSKLYNLVIGNQVDIVSAYSRPSYGTVAHHIRKIDM